MFLMYVHRVKELSSNKGGGGEGVVFSAPPPLSQEPSDQSPSYDEEVELDPTAVPDSPVHADLEYLHRSLQKVCNLIPCSWCICTKSMVSRG